MKLNVDTWLWGIWVHSEIKQAFERLGADVEMSRRLHFIPKEFSGVEEVRTLYNSVLTV